MIFKPPSCLCLIIQLNIGTTACHVGCDGNGTMHTCICNDLSLQLMELRIQYLMRDALSSEACCLRVLGSLDRDRTNQNRLSLRMCLLQPLQQLH